MPVVRVTERLLVPEEVVWNLVCDLESYPKLMESVVSIGIVSVTPGPDGTVDTVADWEIVLKGSILKWRERDHRDPTARRVTYSQVSGDMERFQGYWQVSKVTDEITEAVLEVDFSIGIEMLRPMLEPVAVRAVHRNSTEMLRSLGPRAE
jgi:ribosome-associated toxin RatA of RatAB toxin-antitoxin module